MRNTILIIFLLLAQNSFSQTDAENTVYKVVEEMPRFPGCEDSDLELAEKKQCAENEMLKFIYSNIKYPSLARQNGVEGKVIVQFEIGKEGEVRNPKIVRNIGDGCGDEVMRVMALMQNNIKWIPGMHKGEKVKVQYTLPVRFKLEGDPPPPPPYYTFGTDTVYYAPTNFPKFKGGEEALNQFLAMNTIYPESGLDSCSVGTIMASLIIQKDGKVNMLDTRDFNQLGTDFLFEAIRVIPQLENKWDLATFDGREVNSFYALKIDFKPTAETCKSVVENYDKSVVLAEDAFNTLMSKEYDKGLEKINEALSNFPTNTEWLTTQGMIYFGLKENDKACGSFQKIRDVELVPNYEDWINTVCQF